MNYSKRILICPLDWGLGHATRCIPIIHSLIKKDAEVIIAGDGRSLELLKQEFPQLKFIIFKGYNISYPETGSMVFKMFRSIPKILTGIKKEHKQLEKIIDEFKIDIVISDNRYGCWNKKVKCIFITHQLMIKAPFGENILQRFILSFIKKYNECWVPDNESFSENLSGDLSHKYSLSKNTFFIGPLSRFNIQNEVSNEYDLMAIISGPEPQRSKFQLIITDQLYKSNLKAIIVCGIPEGNKKTVKKGTVTIYDHLNSEEMERYISRSAIIISRSGYSTIMDLAKLNKRAIFIPTPGQTEQEYLSEILMKKKIAFSQHQEKFDLKTAIEESENYKGFNGADSDLLQKKIDELF